MYIFVNLVGLVQHSLITKIISVKSLHIELIILVIFLIWTLNKIRNRGIFSCNLGSLNQGLNFD